MKARAFFAAVGATAWLLCLTWMVPSSPACTTAVISGKCTLDGRPILFKQRDADELDNKLMAFSDGRFDYVGLVNAEDAAGREVWGGFNKAGFAIINSDSENLKSSDPAKDMDRDGLIMKMALQKCQTVGDFEKLLDSLPKPWGVGANFGVIDAQGGAAYYETSNERYVKFDANDKRTAPLGYLVRTNFAYSGDRSRDNGLSRYRAAQDLLHEAALTNGLCVRFMTRNVARSLRHGLTKVDLSDHAPAESNEPRFHAFRDFIPRHCTAATMAVQGVKGGESPALTTMWTILGSPLTAVAVPVWIAPGRALPKILSADKTGKAPLCTWSLQLKKRLFPIETGEGADYINLSMLVAKDNSGIYQKVLPLEDRVAAEAENYQRKWRAAGAVDDGEAARFYDWVDRFIAEAYRENFALGDEPTGIHAP